MLNTDICNLLKLQKNNIFLVFLKGSGQYEKIMVMELIVTRGIHINTLNEKTEF